MCANAIEPHHTWHSSVVVLLLLPRSRFPKGSMKENERNGPQFLALQACTLPRTAGVGQGCSLEQAASIQTTTQDQTRH